jgi:hypothetical protein
MQTRQLRLYITVDDINMAWINGVRVGEKFRRLGYGSGWRRGHEPASTVG